MLCGNCEEVQSTMICEQCEGEDSFFCQQCWTIHIQVKAFRKHSCRAAADDPPPVAMLSIPQHQKIKIENKIKIPPGTFTATDPTEASSAPRTSKDYLRGVENTFLNITDKRLSCEEEMEAMLSEPAPRIENDSTTRGSMHGDPMGFLEHCDCLIEACSDVGELSTKTALYGFITALLVHVVTKILFGRLSIFVVVCLGVALLALVRKKQNIVSLEISKLQDANSDCRAQMRSAKIGDPTATVDTKHDFWHADRSSAKDRVPGLRPRVRPYRQRHSTLASTPSDSKKMN